VYSCAGGSAKTPIKRFEESGVSRVACPGCGRTWTLAPRGGVLRFKSHDKRKTDTPHAERRWARGEGETDWDVVEGERG
ncbi:MAG TPA: ATP-binding protein, partial [Ktedonosporobacter sp.]|nr:ATP-binding protein [Ktedonosporobacter sp.]